MSKLVTRSMARTDPESFFLSLMPCCHTKLIRMYVSKMGCIPKSYAALNSNAAKDILKRMLGKGVCDFEEHFSKDGKTLLRRIWFAVESKRIINAS